MNRPRTYLLSGEAFLADEALDRLRAEIGADPLSEASFDAGADTTAILEALDTPTLLGGERLVIVRDAQSLKKDQAEALAPHIREPAPGSVLVLVAEGRTKLDAEVRKHGAVVGLEAPKGQKLTGWIRARATEHRLNLDGRAAKALLDSVGGDLRELDSALEQLATRLGPGAKVDVAEIQRSFARLADERIYVWTDAVGERRLDAAMGTLRRLLDQGDEPLMLFGALTAHIRRMLTASRLVGGGPRALGSALGMPEWRAERLMRQVRTYREDELVTAMNVLATTDVEMKGGDLPSEVALERAVVQIVKG